MKQATRSLTVEVSATLVTGRVACLSYDLTVMADDTDEFACNFARDLFRERFGDACTGLRAEVTKRG